VKLVVEQQTSRLPRLADLCWLLACCQTQDGVNMNGGNRKPHPFVVKVLRLFCNQTLSF